jgi:hypothetical protein
MDVNGFIENKIKLLEDTGGIQPIDEGDPAWWQMRDLADSLELRGRGSQLTQELLDLAERRAKAEAEAKAERGAG